MEHGRASIEIWFIMTQWELDRTSARYVIIKNWFMLSVRIYILLDVLLCSIAEYFYELCRILASP